MADTPRPPLAKKWYTCAEVAEMLGFGESKVRMLVIQGDLRSLQGRPVATASCRLGSMSTSRCGPDKQIELYQ